MTGDAMPRPREVVCCITHSQHGGEQAKDKQAKQDRQDTSCSYFGHSCCLERVGGEGDRQAGLGVCEEKGGVRASECLA